MQLGINCTANYVHYNTGYVIILKNQMSWVSIGWHFKIETTRATLFVWKKENVGSLGWLKDQGIAGDVHKLGQFTFYMF